MSVNSDIKEKLPMLINTVLFNNLYIAFYCIDKNGILLDCNEKELEISGVDSAQEVIGKHVAALGNEGAWKNSQEIMASGVAKTFEEHAMIGGEERIFLSVKNPIIENNEVVGLFGISFDITARKEAEELRIKHEAAQRTIEFVNLFAGAMAHELRHPLFAISLHTDILDNCLASPKKTKQEKEDACLNTIDIIKNSSASANWLIDNMLLKLRCYATGEAPKVEHQKNSIATDVQNFLAAYPFVDDDERQLIKTDLTDDFYYMGNATLTKHVLVNLFKNALRAVKSSDKDRKECEITFTLKSGRARNHLIFRDNALGMDPHFASKIFDQFFTKTKDGSGTGLGLAFCKMVMELYGGSITCDAQPGEFTEFSLCFPAMQ